MQPWELLNQTMKRIEKIFDDAAPGNAPAETNGEATAGGDSRVSRPGAYPQPCPTCAGRGELEDSGDSSVGYGPVMVECRDCEGKGVL